MQLRGIIPLERDYAASSCDRVPHRFGHAADHPDRARAHPTDLTDPEWAEMAPLIPAPARTLGRGGRSEEYCHHQLIDAVLYLAPLTELNLLFLQVEEAVALLWHDVPVLDRGASNRDLAKAQISRVRRLAETSDPFEPYLLLDPVGEPVEAVTAFFRTFRLNRSGIPSRPLLLRASPGS